MKTYLSYFSIALLLFSWGCATEGPYLPAQRESSPEMTHAAVILDQELAKLIAVDAQKTERTSQGKLKALANIRNRSNQDLTVQVQTIFRDANGFSISDDTPWETIVLTANETKTITATSTNKKAERYSMRVRMVR